VCVCIGKNAATLSVHTVYRYVGYCCEFIGENSSASVGTYCLQIWGLMYLVCVLGKTAVQLSVHTVYRYGGYLCVCV
jgi:hypothetical protein